MVSRIKRICLFVLLPATLFCEPEIIRITGDLNSRTETYMWPALANGGIYMDSINVYISNVNSVYIQSRANPAENVKDEINIKGVGGINITAIHVSNKDYFITYLGGDGRVYLLKKDRFRNSYVGPKLKHGNLNRLFQDSRGNVLVGGNYRPQYVKYLDLYDDETAGGPTEISRSHFKKLFQETRSFTLSVFDDSLALVDSANIIDRFGDDGENYDHLYLNVPIDVSSKRKIYLIDHDLGYIVEKYSGKLKLEKTYSIKNAAFKSIPSPLTKGLKVSYGRKPNAYSIVYALYLKSGYIITSFHGSTTGRDLPAPPFYYDIINTNGELVKSGRLAYPIICEDESDKVFLFVRHPGGLFGKDQLYLVGLTMKDFFEGRAEKHEIDVAIKEYEKDQ